MHFLKCTIIQNKFTLQGQWSVVSVLRAWICISIHKQTSSEIGGYFCFICTQRKFFFKGRKVIYWLLLCKVPYILEKAGSSDRWSNWGLWSQQRNHSADSGIWPLWPSKHRHGSLTHEAAHHNPHLWTTKQAEGKNCQHVPEQKPLRKIVERRQPNRSLKKTLTFQVLMQQALIFKLCVDL